MAPRCMLAASGDVRLIPHPIVSPLTSTALAWRRRWRSTRVTIEGHRDARATGEYNPGPGIAAQVRPETT
jgi:hypothetical protein